MENSEALASGEARFGVRQGDLFLTDPECRVDARLTRFFTRSAFARLARETKRNYATDLCVLFDFLWQREKTWVEATADDLFDFEDWRRRSPANPRRISGSKWNRELAAFQMLFTWAAAQEHIQKSPILMRQFTARDRERGEIAALKAIDARSSNVKWLTPRTFRLWRDVGLRGFDADGRRDRSWAGRNDDRNAAFADLLLSSGMRRTEAGSLLTVEIPTSAATAKRFYDGRLASAVTKSRRARTVYIGAAPLKAIETYMLTTRRAAIRRAQAQGVYERFGGLRMVERTSGREHQVLHWTDRFGQAGMARLDALDPQERLSLFSEGPEGPEPLWLWLAENGMPFRPHSWEAVFRSASDRCRRVLAGSVEHPPFLTPHMARHSMALVMLVALHHAMDLRLGLTVEERRDYRLLYGDPWRMVKDLLGHASVETTRNIYLAPVADLQLRSLLTDEDLPDIAGLLARLAAASDRILDLGEVA
ncbi:site-specific integrase [Glycomyces sp. MUSA5-2]|uniref:site-specific integrase n=1 Tax=Glycomyces sp. MUSA5-2 TaxID=2053002 RepID=UPI00300B23B6